MNKECEKLMKKIFLGSLILIMVMILGTNCFAATIPDRYATKVNNVNQPYSPDDWIVSPTEEPAGDQTAPNALETDIKGVISCYDANYLRVDILLNNSVSNKWKVYYSIKFEYDNLNEYYTYYPDSEELVYEHEVNGKITKSITLDTKKSDDYAGVTSSGSMKNNDIYFIINKNNHLEGQTGKTYYLTTSFESVYVDTKGNLVTSDDTIDVDLYFVK